MSYPVWPVDLPRPERRNWQLQRQDARRKRGFENGPPGYRRRFSSVGQLVQFSVLLSAYQRAVFDRFWRDDCAEGSSLFWMPDPTRDGWPIAGPDGSALLTGEGLMVLMAARWLCSWADQAPVETIEGVEFRKSCSVVVMP